MGIGAGKQARKSTIPKTFQLTETRNGEPLGTSDNGAAIGQGAGGSVSVAKDEKGKKKKEASAIQIGGEREKFYRRAVGDEDWKPLRCLTLQSQLMRARAENVNRKGQGRPIKRRWHQTPCKPQSKGILIEGLQSRKNGLKRSISKTSQGAQRFQNTDIKAAHSQEADAKCGSSLGWERLPSTEGEKRGGPSASVTN